MFFIIDRFYITQRNSIRRAREKMAISVSNLLSFNNNYMNRFSVILIAIATCALMTISVSAPSFAKSDGKANAQAKAIAKLALHQTDDDDDDDDESRGRNLSSVLRAFGGLKNLKGYLVKINEDDDSILIRASRRGGAIKHVLTDSAAIVQITEDGGQFVDLEDLVIGVRTEFIVRKWRGPDREYDAVLVLQVLNNAPLPPAGANVNFTSEGHSDNSESKTSVNIPVKLSKKLSTQATVDYSVTGGTATGGGVDYTLTNGALVFSPGETTKNIQLIVNDDSLDEPNETVNLMLSNPSNATLGSLSLFTYEILYNDAPTALPTVKFSVGTSSGIESETSIKLPVELTASSLNDVTVNYAVTGGTATGSGTDFTLASGVLTIPAGSTTKDILMTVVNDTLDEDNETVVVTLSAQTNALLGTSVHTYTIMDNDQPSVGFVFSAIFGSESLTSPMVVTLSAASTYEVKVDYAVTGGTATGGGVDYTLSNGTLTFAPGETTKTLPLSVIDDAVDEPDETIAVSLSNQLNATLGVNASSTYTIFDNDDD